MTVEEIEKLITDYGNASFDCGDHRGSHRDYQIPFQIAEEAKKTLMDAVLKLMKTEGEQ